MNQVAAFIQEEELVQRILILIKNNSLAVKCESLFVITNAIVCSDTELRMNFFSKFKQDLIDPLCKSIEVVKHKKVILIEIVTALACLLELDMVYPNDLVEENSVKFMIDSASGFDSLNEL